MMKEYKVNNIFNKEAFVAELKRYGVNAYATPDAIIFNEKQFRNLKAYEISHWLYINRKYMLRG